MFETSECRQIWPVTMRLGWLLGNWQESCVTITLSSTSITSSYSTSGICTSYDTHTRSLFRQAHFLSSVCCCVFCSVTYAYICERSEVNCVNHQIKQVRSGLRADMKQVSKSTCHHQSCSFSLTFQQRISRHCGAHPNPANQRGVQRLIPRKAPPTFLFNKSDRRYLRRVLWLLCSVLPCFL